jgi:hypothetical protein
MNGPPSEKVSDHWFGSDISYGPKGGKQLIAGELLEVLGAGAWREPSKAHCTMSVPYSEAPTFPAAAASPSRGRPFHATRRGVTASERSLKRATIFLSQRLIPYPIFCCPWQTEPNLKSGSQEPAPAEFFPSIR